MSFIMNLQLFGGRGGSSGRGGGGNGFGNIRHYEGNPIPEDEYDLAMLQNLISLRERWGRQAGSDDPKKHLYAPYIITTIENGKVTRESMIATEMQIADELNRREEAHGNTIKSKNSKYSVSAAIDLEIAYRQGGLRGYDKHFGGDEMRKIQKRGKTPY